jgi:hypothetical protein
MGRSLAGEFDFLIVSEGNQIVDDLALPGELLSANQQQAVECYNWRVRREFG